MPLESIEIPQLIFNKGWIRPTLLVRHLNLGECGFPGLNICVLGCFFFPKACAFGWKEVFKAEHNCFCLLS